MNFQTLTVKYLLFLQINMEEKIKFIKANWLNHTPGIWETIKKENDALASLMYLSYKKTGREVFEDMLPLINPEIVDTLYKELRTLTSNRKIILEAMDPTGSPIGKSIELNYYNLGWEKMAPEDYPEGQEPMRVVRYLLTIGDHKYWLRRNGQIIDQLTTKEE